GRVYRQDSQGGKAGRPARGTADEVRIACEFKDCARIGADNQPRFPADRRRGDRMRRREFIALLGGAVAAWPIAARGQQRTVPVIGFLGPESSSLYVDRLPPFRQALSEAGFVEERTVAILYRWVEGQKSRLPTLLSW